MENLEAIKLWIGTNLPKYELPPSRFEMLATADFVSTGLKDNNRLLAVASAIPAIAASTIMIIIHPVLGLLNGVVDLTQLKISDGAYKVTLGLFNSTRSIYNIILIFGTAIRGLAQPSQFYNAMTHVLKKEEIETDEYKELTARLKEVQAELDNLRKAEDELIADAATFKYTPEQHERLHRGLRRDVEYFKAISVRYKKEIADLQSEKVRLEGEIKTANVRITELIELAENAQEHYKTTLVKFISISKLAAARSKHEKALEDLRKQIETLTEQKTTHEKKIAQLEADGNATSNELLIVKAELEEVNAALRKALDELDNATKSRAEETEALNARIDLEIENLGQEELKPLQAEHEQLTQKLAIMRAEMTALQEAMKTAQQNNVSVEPTSKALGEVNRILATDLAVLKKLTPSNFHTDEAKDLFTALKTIYDKMELLVVQNTKLQDQVNELLKGKQDLKNRFKITPDQGSTPEIVRTSSSTALEE